METVPQLRVSSDRLEELEIKLGTNGYNASGFPTKPGWLLYMFIEITRLHHREYPLFFLTLTLTLGISTLYIVTYCKFRNFGEDFIFTKLRIYEVL